LAAAIQKDDSDRGHPRGLWMERRNASAHERGHVKGQRWSISLLTSIGKEFYQDSFASHEYILSLERMLTHGCDIFILFEYNNVEFSMIYF
jgi:hypothetical protein